MVINYYLQTLSNDISFENDLISLFKKFPKIDKTLMGFPENWNGFRITPVKSKITR